MVNKSYLNQVRKMEEIPNFVNKALNLVKYNERVNVLRKRGAILFKGNEEDFEKVGYDIYKKKTDADAGSIWVIETIKNANGKDERWVVVYTGEDDKIIRQVKASIQKKEEIIEERTKIEKTSSKKISYTPGTVVQINVPFGHLYEKYNGKIGEVRSAVPDRSQVIFKDMPSSWFEDNTIRAVASCSVCNKEISLQGLKTVGKIQCKCKASYNRNQLEKVVYTKRVNEKASLKKRAQFVDSDVEDLHDQVLDAFGINLTPETSKELYDFLVEKDKNEGVGNYSEAIKTWLKGKNLLKFAKNKKSQNVIMWFDNPKALKYLKELNTPSSPVEESLEKPEEETEEEIEKELGEEVEKEASIKKISFKVGDKVQIMDKEENTTIAPSVTIAQVDEYLGNDGDMHETIEITGSGNEDEQLWYNEEEYSIVLLKEASKKTAEHDNLINIFTADEAKRIGDSLGVDWKLVNLDEFTKGMNVEIEHSGVVGEGNATNYAKIALDHLNELPDYYTRLYKMEEEGEGIEKEIPLEAINEKISSIIKEATIKTAVEISLIRVERELVESEKFLETLGYLGNEIKHVEQALREWLDQNGYLVNEKEFQHLFGIAKRVVQLYGRAKKENLKKTADGMEALRGGGGAGSSSKLQPMNWTVKETGHPKLPGEPKKLLDGEEEPEEEELEEITITLNPETKDFSINFGDQEGVTEEKKEEEEPKGAEVSPSEQPIEPEEEETEEVEEEESDLESPEVF